MLVDQFGRPLVSESRDPSGLEAGWIPAGDMNDPFSSTGITRTGLDRTTVRDSARAAYMVNGLLYGALDVLLGLVLGDGVSYGEMHDEDAELVLEDF